MLRHLSDLSQIGPDHHLRWFHLPHSGRWVTAHPTLASWLLACLLAWLIIGLLSVIYTGIATGMWKWPLWSG